MNYAGAGLILLSSDINSVLLVKDARTGKWGFTKGHREPYDSSDLETAQRELWEEAGIASRQYKVINEPFKIKKSKSSYIFRYAVMLENERWVRLKPGPVGEVGGLAWVPIRELLDMTHIMDGNLYLRTWLDDLRNGSKRYTGLYLNLLKSQPVQIPMSTCNVVTSS